MTQPPEWSQPGGEPTQPQSDQPQPDPTPAPEPQDPPDQAVPQVPTQAAGPPVPPPPPPGPGAPQQNPYGPNPYGSPNPYAGGPGGPSGPGPYTPAQAAKPPMGLSITSFVLGLLGCLPLASIAAIIVGIVALVRRQAMRGLAIAGIVLGVLWTVGFVAFFASGMPERITQAFDEAVEQANDPTGGPEQEMAAFGLEVGDCFNDPAVSMNPSTPEGESEDIDEVTCDEPHDLEVYHVHTLPDGDYPGDEAVETTAFEVCAEEFNGFIGTPYEESDLEIYFYYPIQATWDFANDRSITCTVTDLSGKTTGTLQGANR